MRRTLTGAAALALALALTLAACGGTDGGEATDEPMSGEEMTDTPMAEEGMSGEEMTEDDMPGDDSDMATRTGTLAGMNEHMLAGTVRVSDTEIVLTGFSSDEAGDLRLHLTHGTDETAVDEGMEIGTVSADQESQTFALDGIAVADFDTVVITGGMDGAVFGTAPLS